MKHEEPPAEVRVDDRVALRPSGIEGYGLFTTKRITAGTVVIRLAGRLVSSAELNSLIAATKADPNATYLDSITVYEDVHLVLPPRSIVHFVNHSCDPTLWHTGPYEVAARRDIQPNEELTIDYGTMASSEHYSLACSCGSALCRGEVCSNDWRRPELRERYRGHWVPALQHRIDGGMT